MSSWSPLDDLRLREFYAQYPPDQPIPIAEIAAILGKEQGSVRTRAHALGITSPDRPRGNPPLQPAACPICGAMFLPRSRGRNEPRIRTCSTSCGHKLTWQENEHPRGATGLVHSPETRAVMSEKSKAWWDSLPDDERSAKIGGWLSAPRPRPTERTHTRARGGRRADLDDRYFRSSWEANYARWLNFLVANGVVASWEYEPRTFTFPVKRGTMSYTPDFLVVLSDGTSAWHEVKGWLTQQGATALKRFAKFYPDETLVMIDAPVYQSIAEQARSLIPTWE